MNVSDFFDLIKDSVSDLANWFYWDLLYNFSLRESEFGYILFFFFVGLIFFAIEWFVSLITDFEIGGLIIRPIITRFTSENEAPNFKTDDLPSSYSHSYKIGKARKYQVKYNGIKYVTYKPKFGTIFKNNFANLIKGRKAFKPFSAIAYSKFFKPFSTSSYKPESDSVQFGVYDHAYAAHHYDKGFRVIGQNLPGALKNVYNDFSGDPDLSYLSPGSDDENYVDATGDAPSSDDGFMSTYDFERKVAWDSITHMEDIYPNGWSYFSDSSHPELDIVPDDFILPPPPPIPGSDD